MTRTTTLTRPSTLTTVRFVAWGNAALDGRTSLDEAAEACAPPRRHRIHGLADDTAVVNLAYGLGRLRALGVTRLRAVLPVPGDVAGLPGPIEFNQAALTEGAAVVAVAVPPLGLVPRMATDSVDWAVSVVSGTGEGATSDLVHAERELMLALAETTEELVRLDIARWRPELAAALHDVRGGPGLPLPPGHPPRAVRLATQAVRLLRVAELAIGDDGSAVSGSQVRARAGALARLHDAARRALAASATGC